MNTQHIPTNEDELATDVEERVREMTERMALEAVANGGDGFTAAEIARRVVRELPVDYPRPRQGSRFDAIHAFTSGFITTLMKDVPGAIEWVELPEPRSSSECPSFCNYHSLDPELDGYHFGRIRVNDIEIDVEWCEDDPKYGDPRVDVSGYEWVNGPDLTDLAEALHIAERLLSGPEQVSA